MSFTFPQNPTVGLTTENGNVTYTWDGTKWVSTTGPFVSGSTGPQGATGATGPVGAFDGKTPINSSAIVTTESFVVAGIRSDSVAIGPRDNYFFQGGTTQTVEHANLMFNHFDGAPDRNGNSARISLNAGQTGTPAKLSLAMRSNVSAGTTITLNRIAEWSETEHIVRTDTTVVGDLNVSGTVFGNLIGNIDGNVSGNAGTATRLQTARTISLAGDVAGSTTFDGTTNVTINSTIQPNSVALGADTTGEFVSRGATSGNGISGSTSGENKVFTVTSNATASSNSNTIVFRDSNSSFSANRITANQFNGFLNGNAATASKWATARTITLSGDLGGSVSIDGSANVTLSATIQPNSVALATDTTGDYVSRGVTSGNGISGSTSGENQVFTVTSNATSANNANTIVYRDSSRNFSAGTITANLSGRATVATNADTATISNTVNISASNTVSADYYMYFGGASGGQTLRSDNTLRYRPNTNTLSATNISATTITASTVNANINGSISGNADTATRLLNTRTINGVGFNGTANITITANTPNSLTPGSYLLGSSFNGSAARTFNVNATTNNTVNAIVARDGGGDIRVRSTIASGNVTASGILRSGSGSVSSPGVQISESGNNSGFYAPANSQLAMSLDAVNYFTAKTNVLELGYSRNYQVNVGSGTLANTIVRINKSRAGSNLPNHLQIVSAGTVIGEIGALDTTWLRINQNVAKNIYTPRMIRADGGFEVDASVVISGTGVHTGNGSGLTSLNATQLTTGTVPRARLSGTYDISTTGNSATSSRATTVDVSNTNSGTYRLVFSLSGNSQTLRSDTGITVQPGSNLIQASTFRGTLDGRAEAALGLSPKTGTSNQFAVTAAGMYAHWNRDSNTGSSYFVNQKGSFAGGWRFVAADTGGNSATDADVLLIEEDGRVTIQGPDKTFVGNNFTGTAANSNLLDNLDSTAFIRRDTFTTVTASTRWNDTQSVRLGSSDDLLLYHDGADSYIDNYTRHLFIRTNVDNDDGGNIYIRPKANENGIVINNDSSVQLYFDNSKKLETNSGGITVTGTVTATTFSGSLSGTASRATQSDTARVTHDTGNAWHRFVFVDDGQGSNSYLSLKSDNGSTVAINPNTNELRATRYYGAVTGNGANITALNATQLTTGTVPRARLTGDYDISITGNAASASNASRIFLASRASSTAVHYITFSAGLTNNQNLYTDNKLVYLPAFNAMDANITGRSAVATKAETIDVFYSTNTAQVPVLASDTTYDGNSSSYVSRATRGPGRFSFNRNTGDVYAYRFFTTNAADGFVGNGSRLTGLNATNISRGELARARLTGTYDISITGGSSSATNSTNAQNVRVDQENNTNANNRYLLFTNGSNDIGIRPKIDIDLSYNPGTNTLTAGAFRGNGAGLTNLPQEIPAGTRMIFQQPNAPTGWTRIESGIRNDTTLRVNRKGTNWNDAGGSLLFRDVFNAVRTVPLPEHGHTASASGQPDHNHNIGIVGVPNHSHGGRTGGDGQHSHGGRTGSGGNHTHSYDKSSGSTRSGNGDTGGGFQRSRTSGDGGHSHNIPTQPNHSHFIGGDGTHSHNANASASGGHGHNINVSVVGVPNAAMTFDVRYADVIVASKNA